MKKFKLLTLLAALVCATSMWAGAAYSIALKGGTEDASNWSLNCTYAGKGVTVTVTYNGSKTVKNVAVLRKYLGIIDLNSTNTDAAQNDFNSTPNSKIVASTDFNAGLTFTREEGEIDLNGHANSSWFCVQNNTVGQAITIRNGSFLDIDGKGGWNDWYNGTVILEDINCRYVFTDGHDYVIQGGSYQYIENYKKNGTPGTVTIYGGKFSRFNTSGASPSGSTGGTYTLYGGMYKFDPTTAANCTVIIPDGYSVQLNPDLDNRDYPWAVVKNSDPYAQTNIPGIELTQVAPNQWSFTMPAYNVELEVTYMPFYNVALESGTLDAANWTINPNSAQAGATVAMNYNGAYKVDNIVFSKKDATLLDGACTKATFEAAINDPTVEHPYVQLTEDISTCMGSVYITKQEGTVDLSTYKMCANLYIQNNVEGKTLTLRNGHVQGGADGDGGCPGSRRGTVVLDNMVIDGTLWCDGHEFYIYNTTIGGDLQNIQFNNYPSKVTIFSGHFSYLRHACGNITGRGQYVVYGGKFKEDYTTWNICAPGYSFQANTDGDAATYPYEVKPTPGSGALSPSRPRKVVGDQTPFNLTEVYANHQWTFTMPDADVEAQIQYGLQGQGTEEDPYIIPSLEVWNIFASCVEKGNTYAGKFIRQTADISGVTKMVGTATHLFAGTYDGGGYTLNVNINGGLYAAPFSYISGATIKNVHTTGTVVSNGRFCSGIVGAGYNGNNVINCRSSVDITGNYNGDASAGTVVGIFWGSTNYIEGCLFDGSISSTSTTRWSGIAGWTEGGTTTIRDCLFKPKTDGLQISNTSGSATISRSGTKVNCYYTQTLGSAQGKEIRSITAGESVTVAPAGTPTVYNVSGITSYGTGIKYNNVLYGGDGDAISLTLGGAVYYTATTGTLAGSANPYTLTMANANSEINFVPVASVTVGTTTTGYPTFAEALNHWVNNSTLKLLANVTHNQTITINNTRTLDLNGYGIKRTGSGRVIQMNNGGNLTINDSNPDAEHKFTVTNAYGDAGLGVVNDDLTENYLTFHGGYITGGNNANGAGIYAQSNTSVVTINGGVFIGNGAGSTHAGFYWGHTNPTLIMNGGRVIYNMTACQGAGIFFGANATFRLYGGEISHNRATGNASSHAGGICVSNDAIFYLHGAPIVTANIGGNSGSGTANQPNDVFLLCKMHIDGELTNTTPIGVTPFGSNNWWNGKYPIQISFESEYVHNSTPDQFVGQAFPSDNIVRIGDALWMSNPSNLTTAPTAISGLEYTGAAQALVTAGEATGGTMKYSLDNNTWSADIPTGINPGNYTVYYMVEGDATHADFVPSPNMVEVTIATPDALAMDDDVDNAVLLASLNDGNARTITINRKLLRNGDYNTVCLPFDLSAAQLHNASNPLYGCTVSELTKMWTAGNELRLLMQPVNAIVAGKPYLVKYNGEADDLTQLVFEGVTVTAVNGQTTVVEGATMYGILEPTLLEVDNHNILFLAAGNTLKWNATGSNLRAFRAYFDITGGPSFAPIHRGMPARIVEHDNSATDIESVEQPYMVGKKYLENGMLIIEKNGVKYNAQGQIVK